MIWQFGEQGYDISDYKEFSVHEVHSMYKAKQMDMLLKKKDKKVLENYKKQEKDLRLLTYTVLVEKFNKKYKKLTESQRDLLRKYIYNISNTNSLKEFIEKESIQIKKQLQSFLPKIDDKVTKIKLTEAINQIGNLLKGRIVEDNQVVALMRYYQLVRELKDVSK